MITIRNNNQENTIRKAKSKRNYLPYEYRVRIPIKKQLIKEHIDQTILTYDQFTKSRPTIAKKFRVSERYITQIYSEIKDDPSYTVSYKQGFTVRIKFSCLAKSSQAEIFHQSNNKKNNKKVINNLYVNTPLSPEGKTTVLKNKPKKEKKTIKGSKRDLILRLGLQYKWHYQKQTLTLFAYPTHIIEQASEELSSAMAEYAREGQGIRSTFRYMRKIIHILMQRKGYKPLWNFYYREKEKHTKRTSPLVAPLPSPKIIKAEIAMIQENEAKSQPQSTKKVFPRALLGKAQEIWEKAKNNRISKFNAKRQLAEYKKSYPEGIPLFTEWYNSHEGLAFKKWITE